MRFEEKEFINLTNIPKVFIYFLLQHKEVVYVGQTNLGLRRVYSHYKDKQFDRIYVIECNENQLDYFEDLYIIKYKPVYNYQPNMIYRYSLKKTLHNLKEKYPNQKITTPRLKKMLKFLNIVPIEYHNGLSYIHVEDYNTVVSNIEDCLKGEFVNEIFDIRF